jgi:Tfp pilus assembly protein PilF
MYRRHLPYVIAGIALLACLLAIWTTARAGLSRLLSESVVRSSQTPSESQSNGVATADQAVRLAPSDPVAHRARAVALMYAGLREDAIREYERAVALRPGHYTLWVELGRARDQLDDQQGALLAFTEAARLAPYYAQPHWQLGNVLFRMGRREEAFTELRRAATSDLTMLPAAIDLAWAAYSGDARAVEQVFAPQTAEWRLALARHFAKHGKPAEALQQFRAAGQIPDYERRNFLLDLLTARQFAAAYEVWSSVVEARNGEPRNGIGQITDGSFESGLKFDDPGFGWQLARGITALQFSLDTAEPKDGLRSVRIDFNGEYNPAIAIMTQLALVEPKARYRLHFASRAQEIVTGGMPIITVSDASSSGSPRSLAESSPLPQGSSPWQDRTIEFTTLDETSAVQISVVRQGCGSGPCPIFGRLWLDQFSLEKL